MAVNEPHDDRESRIGRAFVALADTMVDDYDIIDLLDRLIGYSVDLLAADAAGLLLTDSDGTLRSVAASNEDADLIDLLQLQNDEGPSLDAVRTLAPVHVDDVAESDADVRWPMFVTAMRDQGTYRSVLALPMRLRRQGIGALTLFHRTPGASSADDATLGQALADVATIGILSERTIRRSEVVNEQLQTALNSRVVIEQAKGVIAQHAGVDMNAAFGLLRRYARSNNQQLSDVARRVTLGALDPRTVIVTG